MNLNIISYITREMYMGYTVQIASKQVDACCFLMVVKITTIMVAKTSVLKRKFWGTQLYSWFSGKRES